MRTIVFFDLPVLTAEDRRNYRRFHKFLIKNGFIQMQESVYCRLLLNGTAVKTIENSIEKNKPPKGIVQMLTITEKQFNDIKYVVGEFNSDIINSDEHLVIL